jgi:glycine/D-amino acid oxidase-like deaminating enzyme
MWGPTELERPAPAGSLWEATAGPDTAYPALEGEENVEVAVVGAGITGLSTALHLGERGISVAVVDAGDVGWGASGRNGGQVIPGLKQDPEAIERLLGHEMGPRTVSAAGGAPALVFSLVERYGIDCDARPCGWAQPAHCRKAMRVLEARARSWQRRGAPVRILGRDETADLLGTREYVGGIVDLRGGALQPLKYTRGLADAALRKGARIFVRSRAQGLRQAGGHWRFETEHGSIAARRVVLATNGYTDGLWPGLAETVLPAYSFQIATQPLADAGRAAVLPSGHVVSDSRRLLRYFRQVGGRLLMGGRGSFSDAPGASDERRLLRTVRELFPELANQPVEYRWSGRVALTWDHLPHLHALAPGVFAGLGYNGRGIAMGTLMGRWLAELASGGRCEDFPVTEARPLHGHQLYRPVLQGLIGWYRFLDRIEARPGRR